MEEAKGELIGLKAQTHPGMVPGEPQRTKDGG